jgi:hypothetical protein
VTRKAKYSFTILVNISCPSCLNSRCSRSARVEKPDTSTNNTTVCRNISHTRGERERVRERTHTQQSSGCFHNNPFQFSKEKRTMKKFKKKKSCFALAFHWQCSFLFLLLRSCVMFALSQTPTCISSTLGCMAS